MATTGKKGKKNKGTVISLQSFLSNGDNPVGTTQVSKKVRNLDGDESDDGSNSLPQVYQLPTAPRANRIFDDDSIPHKPPFIAYVNNLPFDASEDDIYDFFGSIPLVSLRLPREDGDTGRSRGFGYVELETREDLINVLSLPDPSIKGRRIRIELSNENEQQNNRHRGNRRFEGFGNNSENRDSGNWRRDSQNNGSYNSSNSGSYNNDRGYNRERRPPTEDNDAPGSWRTSSRRQTSDLSPPRRDLGNDRYREGRNRNFDREDRNIPEEPQQERPKLNLKPRTLPLPEIVSIPEPEEVNTESTERDETTVASKPSGISAEKVFGSAKPVDTAARELEIEERLAEARRQDKIRQEQEQSVSDQLSEIQIDKTDQENANSTTSWRRKNEVTTAPSSNSSRRLSPGRQDDKRRERREGDYNKSNKSRDRNDRENQKSTKSNQIRDSKNNKEDVKPKREVRTERPLPKYQPNSDPILQSSNKYSGLDDEASD